MQAFFLSARKARTKVRAFCFSGPAGIHAPIAYSKFQGARAPPSGDLSWAHCKSVAVFWEPR